MRSSASNHRNDSEIKKGGLVGKQIRKNGHKVATGENDKAAVDLSAEAGSPAPFITPRHVHVPHLAEKIELLYQYHPFIRRQYELARELNVAPATLATWINGTPCPDGIRVNPSTIPAKHFGAILRVFGVPAAVLEMADLVEFKRAFATFESGRGAWEKMVRALPDDQTIEITVNNPNRKIKFVPPELEQNDDGILRIHSDDEVTLCLPNPGLRHAVLLQQDRDGWSSLLPTPRWKGTEIGASLLYPPSKPDGSLRFATVEGGGLHLVLAILTRKPLPGWIMDIFLASNPEIDESLREDDLDRTVSVFHNLLTAGPEKCRMFSRRFIVTNAPRRNSEPGTAKKSKPTK